MVKSGSESSPYLDLPARIRIRHSGSGSVSRHAPYLYQIGNGFISSSYTDLYQVRNFLYDARTRICIKIKPHQYQNRNRISLPFCNFTAWTRCVIQRNGQFPGKLFKQMASLPSPFSGDLQGCGFGSALNKNCRIRSEHSGSKSR